MLGVVTEYALSSTWPMHGYYVSLDIIDAQSASIRPSTPHAIEYEHKAFLDCLSPIEAMLPVAVL